MADLHPIRRVVAVTRRRLRLQAALEGATSAAIVGIGVALAFLWLWRMQLVDGQTAGLLFAAAAALVVAGALASSLARHPEAQVAARLDRASGLSDRLGTALDFERRVDVEPNKETQALMRAAIDDALAALPRADARAAAPFRTPHDARALSAFVVVGAAIAALSFHPEPPPPLAVGAAPVQKAAPADESESLDADDLDYQRQYVDELKKLAETTQDETLKQMTQELQEILEEAARGQTSKQALLERMEKLEKKYAEGSSQSLDKLLGGLKDQGQELKKNKVTQRLGDALEKGDMEAAQKELERLADQVDKGAMKPEDQKKLAEALDKSADKQEQRDQKDEERAAKEQKDQQTQQQKKIDQQKDEIRRLEKKVAQNQDDDDTKRTLEKKRRDLERLERDQSQQAEKPKRQLERLSRDMKEAAENLKEKNSKQASQSMRQGAEDMKRAGQKMKQMQNQQRVQSQLRDLKDAIGRAKPRRGNGQKSMAERMREQRVQEWEQRAGGQRGNPQAWRQTGQQRGLKGQGPGQSGQGQKGDKDGQDPGERWGTEHDPHLADDPTRMANAQFDNDQLKGVQGQGASRRETILTSAQKGFAQASYRKVYTEYRKVVEEVMNQEKVPQGYKYYVKRYFQRIKPHSMD